MIDENYIRTLENRIRELELLSRRGSSSIIKSDVEPTGSFVDGQYWFDQRNNVLKVWKTNQFVVDWYSQSQFVWTANSSDNYTFTSSLTPTLTSYVNWMIVVLDFQAAYNASSGTATLNIDWLGAKTIKLLWGYSLLTGDLEPEHQVLMYDWTDFILLSTPRRLPDAYASPSTSATSIQQTHFITQKQVTDYFDFKTNGANATMIAVAPDDSTTGSITSSPTSTGQLTKRVVARLTANWANASNSLEFQKSSDGSSWSALYTYTSGTADFILVLERGFYYRWGGSKNASGAWTKPSWTLQYTT